MANAADILINNLGVWTSAIERRSAVGRGRSKKFTLYGIEKLRALILDLAVRGKLVPQDRTDQPAIDLLNNIRSQKEKLFSAGLIKNSRFLSWKTPAEAPFNLPTGWACTTLGSIAKKLTDGSHNPPPDAGTGIPMLSSQNVFDGTIDIDNPSRFISDEDFVFENLRTRVSSGDVLLTIVASIGRSAVVKEHLLPFALQRSVAVISTDIYSLFLKLMLESSICVNYYWTHAKGTAQKGIYLEQLSQMTLVVPPLTEQRRIVAKVDELMALCDRLEAQTYDAIEAHELLVGNLLATLTRSQNAEELAENWARIETHFDTLFTTEASIDQLKQTILQLAVMGKLVPQDPNDEPASELLKQVRKTREKAASERKIRKLKRGTESEGAKPFQIPDSWAWASFPEIGIFDRGKSQHRPRNDPKLFNPGLHPLIQTGEVARADEYIREFHSQYSDVGLAQSRMWPKGTLCITIAANIADTAILDFDACFPDSVVGFIPFSPIPSPRYFLHFMKTAKADLLKYAPSTAQKNINLGILETMNIPIPPLKEMIRIVERVDELLALCGRLKSILSRASEEQVAFADAVATKALV